MRGKLTLSLPARRGRSFARFDLAPAAAARRRAARTYGGAGTHPRHLRPRYGNESPLLPLFFFFLFIPFLRSPLLSSRSCCVSRCSLLVCVVLLVFLSAASPCVASSSLLPPLSAGLALFSLCAAPLSLISVRRKRQPPSVRTSSSSPSRLIPYISYYLHSLLCFVSHRLLSPRLRERERERERETPWL